MSLAGEHRRSVVGAVQRGVLLATILVALCAGRASAASLESLVSPGDLSAAHSDLASNCAACHSPFEATPERKLCVACHEAVGVDLRDALGLHGRHPAMAEQDDARSCRACHTEHEGLDAVTLRHEFDRAQHQFTDYPLAGAHRELACESCHAPAAPKRAAPTACVGCHAQDDAHGGLLGTECESCHGESSWSAHRFDHAQTGFAITGAHRALTCEGCHSSADFSTPGKTCVSCHAQDDVHAGALGSRCESCHGTATWSPKRIDHSRFGGFALDGGHAQPCASCHVNPEPLAGSTCLSCHADDDIHAGNNGTACASCHGVASWQPLPFDHVARTGFALAGAHAELACTTCHVGRIDTALPRECAGCHAEDPHAGQLGALCATCHGQFTWLDDLRFDHQFAEFPLHGAHTELECSSCHASARFHDAGAECAACHAQDDPHVGGAQQSFGADCGSCHEARDWLAVEFEHAAQTGFALVGAHASLTCESCHAGASLLRAEAADDCAHCHAARDPHAGEFGGDCAQCHSTRAFLPARGLQILLAPSPALSPSRSSSTGAEERSP
ncbi:MAG: cytochrome C [Pseudomonadota bacterium]